MHSIYRSILKKAFQISWRNPWLWFFGVFAALLGGGGEFNLLINNLNSVQNQGAYFTDLASLFSQGAVGAWVQTIFQVFDNLNLVSVVILLLVLILALFILWLGITSQGALIAGVARRYLNIATSFKESWSTGLARFWPVLGLNISGKVVIYILLIILGLPFFWLYVLTDSLVWQWLLLIISFIIFIPLAIIISFLIKYAVIYVVTDNKNFKQSILAAWHLFRKNWIVSVEMAIILFIVNILAGLAIIMALLLLAIPFVLVGFVFQQLGATSLLYLMIIVGLIILLLALFIFGGFLQGFQFGAWIILFTRLTEGVVIPKILRLAAGLMSKKDPPQPDQTQ
jgi:hypothetical protein